MVVGHFSKCHYMGPNTDIYGDDHMTHDTFINVLTFSFSKVFSFLVVSVRLDI